MLFAVVILYFYDFYVHFTSSDFLVISFLVSTKRKFIAVTYSEPHCGRLVWKPRLFLFYLIGVLKHEWKYGQGCNENLQILLHNLDMVFSQTTSM